MRQNNISSGYRKNIVSGLACFIILVFIDQVTKYLACIYLKPMCGFELISGIFQLYYLENRGAAFGMLHDRQLFFVAAALVITLVISLIYLKIPPDRKYEPLRLVSIVLASGAVGNMIDRIFRGYVVDFLYFSLIDFPVFNVADCYVCVGIAALILLLFTCYKEESFDFLIPSQKK